MDRIMQDEVQQLDQDLTSQVLPLLRDHPLIVVGYRGAEPSIMRTLLLEQLDNAINFPNGIFWCVLEDTTLDDLAPMVKELAYKLQDNFALVHIENFDQFMKEFSARIRQGKQTTPREAGYSDAETYDALPFDTRPGSHSASLGINSAILRRIATEHANRTGTYIPDSPDQHWFDERLTNMGLLTRNTSGELTPTNAAILLCSENNRLTSPGNWVEIATPDRPPSAIDGSLVEIYETVFARLDEANRPIRIKGAQSRHAQPYGNIALKELIANALIHRDYECRAPVRVSIDKDFITIDSPGGLDEALIQQLTNSHQHPEAPPIGQEFHNRILRDEIGIGFTAYRNPILAEAFWGLGYVDKAGSGLVDAVKSLHEIGVSFHLDIPEGNDRFIATANLSHLDINESTRTALPRRPSTYWANVTEFLSIPDTVFSAEAKINDYRETATLAGTRHLPPFVLRHGQLFTFSDLRSADSPFAALAHLNKSERSSLDEITKGEATRTILPELLKKTLESHFYHSGMRVDRGRNRAYFRCDRQDARYINYTTMSGKQTTRRVARWPQKLRVGRCEHEAIHYEIAQFGGAWGLVLQPTFIVTYDGVADQLPSREHASVVTRLQSNNYNRNVLADVRFWLKHLETSNSVISIDTGDARVEISTRLLNFEGYSDDSEEIPDDDFTES